MPPRKKTKPTKDRSPLPPSVSGAGATVPPELLLEIIQEAASPPLNYKGKINYRTRALGAMCRVNKHWQSIAQESLYRCLSFVDKPDQMVKLRRTVVASPVIAGIIAELDIHVVGEQELPSAPAAITKAVARRQKAGKDLWDVLEVLTGLKTLKIRRYMELPKAYRERLQATTRFPNLSTVRRFDFIQSDTAIATILIQSMTSLEELCTAGTLFSRGDFHLFGGLAVHLTQLSVTGDRISFQVNNWDDWHGVVRSSKGTLHTLVLENVNNIPLAILESAFELVSSSLLRLFYSTSLPEFQAVLLAALPKFKKLVSLRTSLPTTTALELIPPTIMELGMVIQRASKRPQSWSIVQNHEAVLRATLKRAKNLPNLKILWLDGRWDFHVDEQEEMRFRELKEQAVAEGMTWTLLRPILDRRHTLPIYGSEDERPYIPDLRLIPGVYVARVKTGTERVFDPAVFTRLTRE